MNDVLANPGVWSAVAAFGSLATAVIIARSSYLDRQQQKELAARTVLQPTEGQRTSIGASFWVVNKGANMAWNTHYEVYPPPSEGFELEDKSLSSGVQGAQRTLPVGGAFRVQTDSAALAQGLVDRIGLTVSWTEEHGHRRRVEFEVPVADKGP